MMTYNQWKEGKAYFNYKGHQIAYWQAGNGADLLLIHGFPTSSWDWHKIWLPLTKRFRVHALDMIGFGYSDKPKDYHYSLTDQARLNEYFLKEQSIEKAHLLVHDYGVSVAQEMLASFTLVEQTHTELMSCCFLNGGLFPHLHHARPIQKILNSPVGFLLNRLLTKKTLKKNFDKVYGNKKATDEEIDQFYGQILFNDGKEITHRLMRYITNRRENAHRWKRALTNSKVPLHFINGPLDPVSGRHLADYCKQLLPQYGVDILEGVGHYPHDEAPDQVLTAYKRFIDNNIKS